MMKMMNLSHYKKLWILKFNILIPKIIKIVVYASQNLKKNQVLSYNKITQIDKMDHSNKIDQIYNLLSNDQSINLCENTIERIKKIFNTINLLNVCACEDLI